MIIRLVGAPACGKTTLSKILIREFGLPFFGIAEEYQVYGFGRTAWRSLRQKVDSVPACIVETSGWHNNDAVLCCGRPTYTIMLVANQRDRAHRLKHRVQSGYPLLVPASEYVSRLLKIKPPPLTPHFILRSDGDCFDSAALAALLSACRAFIAEHEVSA